MATAPGCGEANERRYPPNSRGAEDKALTPAGDDTAPRADGSASEAVAPDVSSAERSEAAGLPVAVGAAREAASTGLGMGLDVRLGENRGRG
eukprot:scaffold100396_cov33-Tisochrysis_lutea.AAC.6